MVRGPRRGQSAFSREMHELAVTSCGSSWTVPALRRLIDECDRLDAVIDTLESRIGQVHTLSF